LGFDDPFVLDTMAEEVPAMIETQRRILLASGFRLLVTEEQLQYACSSLTAAAPHGSSSSIAAMLGAVRSQVQEYTEAINLCAEELEMSQDAAESSQAYETEQQQASPDLLQPRQTGLIQLFPGEVITGMLTVQAGHDAGAEAMDAACSEGPQAGQHTHIQQQQKQTGTRSGRVVLRDISNRSSQQDQDATAYAKPAAGELTTCKPVGAAAGSSRQDQEQKQCYTQSEAAAAANGGINPAGAVFRSASSAKAQLLQMTSREEAVGCKRRRSAVAVAAGATEDQVQGQQGAFAGFARSGTRILSKVMRTAMSAAQYLSCTQQ